MSDEKAIVMVQQRPLPAPVRRDLAVAGATGAALVLTWGAAKLGVRLLQRRTTQRQTAAPVQADSLPPTQPTAIFYQRCQRRVYLLHDSDHDG